MFFVITVEETPATIMVAIPIMLKLETTSPKKITEKISAKMIAENCKHDESKTLPLPKARVRQHCASNAVTQIPINGEMLSIRISEKPPSKAKQPVNPKNTPNNAK